MGNKYQFYTILRKAPQVTFTVSPTPADATVKLNGITQNSVNVVAGDKVLVEVNKTGYANYKAKVIVKQTGSLSVVLDDFCLVKATCTVENATITISDGTNTTTVTGTTASLNAIPNSNVTITISKTNFTTKTFTYTNISEHRAVVTDLVYVNPS